MTKFKVGDRVMVFRDYNDEYSTIDVGTIISLKEYKHFTTYYVESENGLKRAIEEHEMCLYNKEIMKETNKHLEKAKKFLESFNSVMNEARTTFFRS